MTEMTESMVRDTSQHDGGGQGEPPPVPLRRRSGPSRLLRALIGVQENVLDWVPEDRPKFTRTGAIVLCTALIAGLSMWIVLHEFLRASLPMSIAGAAFWAIVIGVFDSWLISSSHGVIGRGRFWVLVPRLLISLLIGILISEPVTLKIFESAVVEQIKADNQAAVENVGKGYGNCYPKPTAGADCAAYKLSISAPDSTELDRYKGQRTQLQDVLKPLNKKLDKLNAAVAEECGGFKTAHTSGLAGPGWRCAMRKEQVKTFRSDHGVAEKEGQLNDLNRKITTLTTSLGVSTVNYEREVTRQIEAKMAEERDKHAATPGILERFEALSSLASRSWAVWWAHLLLAGLLIVIDCYPVLTKLMSAPSAYDRRIAAQLESKERLHDNDLRLNERLRTGDGDVRLHQEEARIRHAMEESDFDTRLRTARREADLRERIDALIEQAKRARSARQSTFAE
ncbi:DUF4407 domain-containing protein [Acrocarpospora catenulata]|uniref:DUF4407 domain-containing protein n=1 Tax=Acrocarpospora catenulata TaxID=2836182 RepID=UPI001BDAE8B7|nr:DUF4407 domain-containing protein [Acrocarpospora catenulata]